MGPPIIQYNPHSKRQSSRTSQSPNVQQNSNHYGHHYLPADITTARDNGRYIQRMRMLSSRPYRHFLDEQLKEDRLLCKEALMNFNHSRPSIDHTGAIERARLFSSIIRPNNNLPPNHEGFITGSIGRTSMVEAPFNCDYGYNIHIGEDVIIQSNCYIQDPCRVYIGARTMIGPNVKIYGMTFPLDSRARGGISALAIGQPVVIEEDCFIGGDVIILGGRTIKKGSVIGAGTVVSKVCHSSIVIFYYITNNSIIGCSW